jgi:hypothetical protein
MVRSGGQARKGILPRRSDVDLARDGRLQLGRRAAPARRVVARAARVVAPATGFATPPGALTRDGRGNATGEVLGGLVSLSET